MKSLMLALILALPITAFGDTVNIVLSPGSLSGNPGDTVNFFGTLTNTTFSVLFLNNAQISGLLPSFTGDITPFLSNTPASLAGNQVVTNVGLFDITIPLSIAAGPYVGTFSIFGGPDENANVGI